MTDTAPTALAEWRRGWPVVLAAGIGYGSGGPMILLLSGLFIKPMRDTLGWSTSAVTIAPIITLAWALCYPLAGRAIDRMGSRIVAIAGAVGLGACAAALSVVPISGATLYGIAVLIGICAGLTAVPTYSRAVATWFKRGVGLAFGITLSGSAVVAMIATPFVGRMIADHGWRAGFLALAGVVLCIGLPVILLFYRERPREMSGTVAADAPAIGATFQQAATDLRFWGYLLAFSIACVPLGGFVGHLQPMLADKGFPLSQALSLGVLYAMAISFGKISIGILLDRFWSFGVAAAVTAVAGIGAIALASADAALAMPIMVVITFAIGMGQGAEADFVAYFSLRSFGMKSFATIVGVLGMMSTVGLAIGGFLFGRLFDADGSYATACHVGAACLFLSAALIVATGLSERRKAA
ncbi:MAG: MFS transporter [Sphingobium sp.]